MSFFDEKNRKKSTKNQNLKKIKKKKNKNFIKIYTKKNDKT